jgi:hypothetical protein
LFLLEELAPEVLQPTQRTGASSSSRAAVLAVAHREDEDDAGPLAEQPTDHLGSSPSRTEGERDLTGQRMYGSG